jgi:serine/threonine protein kinase
MSSPESWAESVIGHTVGGQYQIVRLVDAGGMGAVFDARYLPNGHRVALKLVLPDKASEISVERFRRESQRTASLASPSIVRVYEYGHDPVWGLFLVMEFLVGETLAHRLSRVNRLSPYEAARITTGILYGLELAHGQGIIHRDLKPANVFLTYENPQQQEAVKLLDFGISRAIYQEGGTLTDSGLILGTPRYMSPEQARGQRVQPTTDIYAVGAIFYTCVSGIRPHDGLEGPALLLACASRSPPSIAELCPSLPEQFCQLISQAMSFQAADRFSDAKTLRERIVDAVSQALASNHPLHQLTPVAADARTASSPHLAVAGNSSQAVAGKTQQASGTSAGASSKPSSSARWLLLAVPMLGAAVVALVLVIAWQQGFLFKEKESSPKADQASSDPGGSAFQKELKQIEKLLAKGQEKQAEPKLKAVLERIKESGAAPGTPTASVRARIHWHLGTIQLHRLEKSEPQVLAAPDSHKAFDSIEVFAAPARLQFSQMNMSGDPEQIPCGTFGTAKVFETNGNLMSIRTTDAAALMTARLTLEQSIKMYEIAGKGGFGGKPSSSCAKQALARIPIVRQKLTTLPPIPSGKSKPGTPAITGPDGGAVKISTDGGIINLGQ